MNPNEDRSHQDRDKLSTIFDQYLAGGLSPIELGERILAESVSISTSGSANVDLDRSRRTGLNEVVYAQGKTNEDLLHCISRILSGDLVSTEVLATRVSEEQALFVTQALENVRWNRVAHTLRVGRSEKPGSSLEDRSLKTPYVMVVTAGTTDFGVAYEAVETLDWMGVPCRLVQDIGVAGPYRLFGRLEEIRQASVVVVVAGMEAALPSVIAGHVSCPVIGVPTSVGYGTNFGGLTALLGMLNSCGSNVSVVNIDGGFRGGFVAGLMCRQLIAARG